MTHLVIKSSAVAPLGLPANQTHQKTPKQSPKLKLREGKARKNGNTGSQTIATSPLPESLEILLPEDSSNSAEDINDKLSSNLQPILKQV